MPASTRLEASSIPVTVRDAEMRDMAAIQQIYSFYVKSGLSTFEENAPSTDEIVQRWRAVLLLGMPYLVAEAGHMVLGYSYASPYRTRSAYKFTVENSVYVADGFTSRGVGRALLTALTERCAAGGWRQMIAIIGDSSNTQSIELHKSMGFREVGILQEVGFKFDRWVDTVLMQKQLSQSDADS